MHLEAPVGDFHRPIKVSRGNRTFYPPAVANHPSRPAIALHPPSWEDIADAHRPAAARGNLAWAWTLPRLGDRNGLARRTGHAAVASLVRRAQSPRLHASGPPVRAGLDGSLRTDGGCGLADMGLGRRAEFSG